METASHLQTALSSYIQWCCQKTTTTTDGAVEHSSHRVQWNDRIIIEPISTANVTDSERRKAILISSEDKCVVLCFPVFPHLHVTSDLSIYKNKYRHCSLIIRWRWHFFDSYVAEKSMGSVDKLLKSLENLRIFQPDGEDQPPASNKSVPTT